MKSIGDVITPSIRNPFKRRPRNYSLVHRQRKLRNEFSKRTRHLGESEEGEALTYFWSDPSMTPCVNLPMLHEVSRCVAAGITEQTRQ